MSNLKLVTGGGRIPYIDGIRGVASLLVVFCHIAYVFIPGLYKQSLAENDFQFFWNGSLFNVLTNGNTPVQVFFVLSGYLICKNANERRKLVNPYKEYWKLLQIVLPAVVFTAVLMAFNLLYHLEIPRFNSEIIEYNNFKPTIINVLADVFVMPFVKSSSYVGPFWTIKFEFLGAILISVISYSFSTLKKDFHLCTWYTLIAVLLFFFSPNLVSFVWGALVYECIAISTNDGNSLIERVLRYLKNNKYVLTLIFIGGLYFACLSRDQIGIYRPFSIIPGIKALLGVIRSFGLAICLFCIEGSLQAIRNFFSLRIFIWLGSISAYTYAFHWPIILSLGCWIWLKLDGQYPRYTVVAIITTVVLIATILVALFITKLDKQLFVRK